MEPEMRSKPANREFCQKQDSGTLEPRISGVATGRKPQIPYSMEQGIIFREQEIWAQEQGILSAKNEIVAG